MAKVQSIREDFVFRFFVRREGSPTLYGEEHQNTIFILTKYFQHIEVQLDNKMETISFQMALKRDKHEEVKVKIKKS